MMSSGTIKKKQNLICHFAVDHILFVYDAHVLQTGNISNQNVYRPPAVKYD